VFVEVNGLTKIYGQNGQAKVSALNNVSFGINKGEFAVIMGQSGSGKSTLLHLLGGLDRPTSGNIFVENEDITKLDEEKRALWRRRGVGFVFQSFNLIPVLNARENIRLPLLIDGKPEKEANKKADELLKLVGLTDRATHKPNELSGGQQQRVAIARALSNMPAMILADEPTGALDSNTSFEVIGLLKDISKEQNQTVVMVTHNEEMARLADVNIIMKDGSIVIELDIAHKSQ
jgi:putative ABC transport system ATP-binding protein